MKTVCRFLSSVSVLFLLVPLLVAQPLQPLMTQAPVVQESSPAVLSQEQLEAIALQPAGNWGHTGSNVVPEMLPLFREKSLEIGDRTHNYRLHVPANLEPGKKYPLILWLHGIGERGDCNKLQLVHLHHIITYLTGERKRDFFLLVPQHASNEHWARGDTALARQMVQVPRNVRDGERTLEEYKEELTEQMKASFPNADVTIEEQTHTFTTVRTEGGAFGFGGRRVEQEVTETMLLVTVSAGAESNHPLEHAFAMLEQVVEEYPIDENRITLSGLSSGGDGTWRALERRPDLFAAAVPLVSWQPLTDAAIAQSPILKKIPIWAIFSSDDRGIDQAREGIERLERQGVNVRKTEFGICGHNAWTPAMLQADIFSWLLSRAKDGEEFYAVFDPGVDPAQLQGIVDVATRDPGTPTLAPVVDRQPVVESGVTFTAPIPGVERLTQELAQMHQARLEAQRARVIAFVQSQGALTDGIPPVQPMEITLQAARAKANELMNAVHTARTDEEKAVAIARINEAVRELQRSQYGMQPGQITQWVHQMVPPLPPEMAAARDRAYVAIAERYFLLTMHPGTPQAEAALNAFKNSVRKISPEAQMELIPRLIAMARSVEALKALEELLDGIGMQPVPITVIPAQAGIQMRDVQTVPLDPRLREGDGESAEYSAFARATAPVESTTVISAARIIAECDRPWAMTSESLYGMFAADWHREAEAIPDFIVNSTSDELAHRLARSVSEDPEAADFIAACRSILLLQHRPMSSPWFETSGGRLRSEIQYSLSPKGEMFVRFLRVVRDSANNSDKARELSIVAIRTLEKIDLVLEN